MDKNISLFVPYIVQAFWGDDNMKCTQAPEFLSQTQYKVFSCDFKDSGYRSFVGDNIEFACNTTGLPLGDGKNLCVSDKINRASYD